MTVFRVSVKVAEISYPSTFSVVEFLGIVLPPQRNEKQQLSMFPLSRGETQKGGTLAVPPSCLAPLWDKLSHRSIGAAFVVLPGLLQPAEIKNLVEFRHHALDVFWRKATVFHRVDDIAATSVAAPRLCKQTLQSGIAIHRGSLLHRILRTPRPFPWPVIRQQSSARYPRTAEAAARTDRRPNLSRRIVAVGWPVPLAALVLGTRRRAPRTQSGPPLFCCGEVKNYLSYTSRKQG